MSQTLAELRALWEKDAQVVLLVADGPFERDREQTVHAILLWTGTQETKISLHRYFFIGGKRGSWNVSVDLNYRLTMDDDTGTLTKCMIKCMEKVSEAFKGSLP